MLKKGTGMLVSCFVLLAAGGVCFVKNTGAGWRGMNIFSGTVLFIFAVLCFFCGIKRRISYTRTMDIFSDEEKANDALEDFMSEDAVRIDRRGRLVFGGSYFFALDSGLIIEYTDIQWAYLSVRSRNGLPFAQILTVMDGRGSRIPVVSECADENGTEKLNKYISVIRQKNPECITGYSRENSKRARRKIKR